MPAPALRFALLLAGCLCAGPASAATLTLELRDQDGQQVDDAVLYVSHIDAQVPPAAPLDVLVDQVDEAFVPHVRAVTAGSRVSFPNSDHVQHHVYSFSETLTFELPLYSGIPAEPVVFGQTGLVTLGCNIHDHMLGYILVLATPWFAEVSKGHAHISGLPAGALTVEVWHPRLAAPVPAQVLQAGADGALHLTLQVELRPERVVRRAPRRSSSRY